MSKVIQTVEELDAVLHWRGKHAQAIRERDALQQRLTATDERSDLLEGALRTSLLAMKRIYQAGHDRIVDAGGTCDTPEYMMASDPTARDLRALLDAPYPSEAQLVAAGLGYPMSKEGAVKAYKTSLVPRTDSPSNADCEWCHGCGHDPYGEPCVGCCKPAAQPQGEPVAWRGLNADGEVVTEWIDGIPPERMTDLCGNAASFDKIERAYAEQPAPVAWIDWSGGDCPVDADAMVEYSMAGNPQQVCRPEFACRLDWHHDHRPTKRKSNIVKYRPIAEQPAPVAVVLPERRDFSPQSDSEWGWNACLDELKRLNPSLQPLPLQSQPL